ncbi:hypothetical protein [Methylomonas sp. MgM2]
MKWVNQVAIDAAVTAVCRPELVPLAVLGSTGRRIALRIDTHFVAYWLLGLAFGPARFHLFDGRFQTGQMDEY